MNPSIPSALPGAPRAAASNASGGTGFIAEPSDDAGVAANDGVDGGFAAALDHASSEREPSESISAPSSDAATAASTANATGTASGSGAAAPAPTETLDAANADGAPLSTDAARGASSVTSSNAVATSPAANTAAPGWPPPGLSSLFPERPLFGAASAEPLPASGPGATGTAAMNAATLGALPGAATAGGDPATAIVASGHGSLRGRFALSADAIALPADPLGPRLPDAPSAALATSAAASPATLAAAPLAAANDALALALSRQPAPLRMPVLEGKDAELDALASIGEIVAPERLPDGALPLSTASTTALPKLDLAQAFPAPVPLPSKHFAEDVGARLQWIAEQQGGEATLRISPDGLGPVEVRMKLDGDRVELGFSAAQNDTRQALQDALPKLREMLAQQGLQLGHADVGQKHAGASNGERANGSRGSGDDAESDAITLRPTAREATLVIGRSGRGVLDLYA